MSATAALLLLGACAPNAGSTGVSAPVVSREWVTGAAAAALGPDGRFVFPVPAGRGPLVIGEAEARAQAVGWARAVGDGSGDPLLEQDYGGSIPFAKLSDCGRALYARSAYHPIADTIPRPMRNAFGAYWVVRLCSPAGDIPIVVAVAETSELSVRWEAQRPALGTLIGNEFRSAAVPRGTPRSRALPLEPEAAVAFAYRKTGRRVSEVPEFWQRVAEPRPEPITVHTGHWRLKLEAPVRGVGATSGAEYNVSDVVVFWSGYLPSDTTLQVAVSVQPDTALYLPYPGLSDSGPAGQGVQPLVRIGVRAPYSFEVLRVHSP